MFVCIKETNTFNFLDETNLFSWLSNQCDIDGDDGDKCKLNSWVCRNRILCDLCNRHFVFVRRNEKKDKKKQIPDQCCIHRFWQIITHVICYAVYQDWINDRGNAYEPTNP